MKRQFNDNAIAPIIAIDFDDTININGMNTYPQCGQVRKYAKEVINLLHEVGIKIVIWTSRDVAYNQEEKKMYDHLTPMIEFLDSNDIHYNAINKSIQFAPYAYNGRKVYAHMYVDDRAFGWNNRDDNIMLKVLEYILSDIVGIEHYNHLITHVVNSIVYNDTYIISYIDDIKWHVKHWRDSNG